MTAGHDVLSWQPMRVTVRGARADVGLSRWACAMETAGPASVESVRFGVLLKRHRVAAGLSQAALAERARLSERAVSAYERGQRHAPYRDTVALLVQALGLSLEEAAALEATVQRRH